MDSGQAAVRLESPRHDSPLKLSILVPALLTMAFNMMQCLLPTFDGGSRHTKIQVLERSHHAAQKKFP